MGGEIVKGGKLCNENKYSWLWFASANAENVQSNHLEIWVSGLQRLSLFVCY